LEDARRRAADRPDVAARRETLQSARHALSAARREAWPTVDLDGNYYLKREGSNEDVDWDVLFSAEIPLYTGGGWTARKKQAAARLSAAQALHDAALRGALWELDAAHDRLATLLNVLPALERAVKLAEENTKAQSADYRLGLVTNLDVLNGLENLQEARLSLEESQLAAHVAAAELAVAQGTLP
jgi:outer membrane protein